MGRISCQPPATICPTTLFPLFLDSAHTVAMTQHSLDVVKNAVEHLNHGQTPVVTFDQPLFALAKQIQWKWPESYGEDKLVVMFGGLYIEMAAQRTLAARKWLGACTGASRYYDAKDSRLLLVSSPRHPHKDDQITAAALYILQHRAYDRRLREAEDTEDLPEFEDWLHQREDIFQFQYWATVLELEV